MNIKYLLIAISILSFTTFAVDKLIYAKGTINFKYAEDKIFWDDIDNLNKMSSIFNNKKYIPEKVLDNIFSKTIEIFKKPQLSNEFEKFRTEAFEFNDHKKIDYYVERSKPSFMVAIMGESNNIGVNIKYFLNKCDPNNIESTFFNLAKNGFYINNNGFYKIGISDFPVWIKRTDSSFQGIYVAVEANRYLSKWKKIQPKLKGIYKTIALDTITELIKITESIQD